jgi:VWFA-related protein
MLPTRNYLAVLIWPLILSSSLYGQDIKTSTRTEQDIIRVSTELIQTDVLVLNRQGQFIENLKADQFELKVDGKPQPIAFFEKVEAGSINEEAQLAAARGIKYDRSPDKVRPLDRGRTTVFFLDDMHLSPDSIVRIQKLLSDFVNKQMGQNDLVTIVTASNRLGFLQQPTDEKMVLNAAISRLQPYNLGSTYSQAKEFQAFNILEKEPYMDLLNLLPEELRNYSDPFEDRSTISEFQNIERNNQLAQESARANARVVIQQSANITNNMLSSLDFFIRSLASFPERKILFFISDGFLIYTREAEVGQKLKQISDAATNWYSHLFFKC